MAKRKVFKWDGKRVSRAVFHKNYKQQFNREYVEDADVNDNMDIFWEKAQDVRTSLDNDIIKVVMNLGKSDESKNTD